MKKIVCFIFSIICSLSLFACEPNKNNNEQGGNKEITVYTPDGAPALSLAKLLHEDTDSDGVTYNVVPATGIESYVTYEDESKNADVCILPLTDASLHLSSGDKYQLLGIVTHGNFFLMSETETAYTTNNLTDLIGKKIGVVQLGKLPGLVLRSILQREGIPFKVKSNLADCEADVVNLINIAPTAIKKGLGYDLFSMPEPLATVRVKNGFFRVGSVQTLYGGENGYPQAAIVAKRSLIENKKAWVDGFIRSVTVNEDWLKEATVDIVLTAINSHLEEGVTPSFSAANLSTQAIAGCNVRFQAASEAKAEVNGLITSLMNLDANAVKSLADGFFYQ